MPSRTITTTAEELTPQDKLRKSFIVQNEDASINVFVKKEAPGATTVSTTDHDHRIGPGGNLAINNLLDGEEAVQERYTIVAASGTPRISILETSKLDRATGKLTS